MTPQARRQWARVFIGARHQGLGRLKLLLFSVACARQLGSWGPVLVALRVVPRVASRREARAAWHLSSRWAPPVVGAVAVGLVVWGVLSLDEGQAPRVHWEVEDREIPEWLLTDQGDAGVIAKKMPGQKMRGQQAPPCEAPQEALNDACWDRLARTPPCGDFYEYEGHCYVPIVEKKRLPTSVGD